MSIDDLKNSLLIEFSSAPGSRVMSLDAVRADSEYVPRSGDGLMVVRDLGSLKIDPSIVRCSPFVRIGREDYLYYLPEFLLATLDGRIPDYECLDELVHDLLIGVPQHRIRDFLNRAQMLAVLNVLNHLASVHAETLLADNIKRLMRELNPGNRAEGDASPRPTK